MSASLYVEPYNGTIATGGDSLTEDLNVYYEVSRDYSLSTNSTLPGGAQSS
jgi:hypothetical protein